MLGLPLATAPLARTVLALLGEGAPLRVLPSAEGASGNEDPIIYEDWFQRIQEGLARENREWEFTKKTPRPSLSDDSSPSFHFPDPDTGTEVDQRIIVPSPKASPEQAEPSRAPTSSSTANPPTYLQIETELLLSDIRTKREEIGKFLDRMFRKELLHQTGKALPSDFIIEDLDEQIDALHKIYSKKRACGLKAERSSLTRLLTSLEQEDPIFYNAEKAIKVAVNNSINTIDTSEW